MKEIYNEKYCVTVLENGSIIGKSGKILKPIMQKDGYFRVSVYFEKKLKTIRIHRLVAETFFGKIPKGLTVNHIDGNKTNNAIINLEIVTYSQNSQHAWDNKLNIGNTKLSKEQIQEIILYPKNIGASAICKKYGVSRHTINYHRLQNFGNSWKKRIIELPKYIYWVESKKRYRIKINKKYYGSYKKIQDAKNSLKNVLENTNKQ
jgi:hypothetical protein